MSIRFFRFCYVLTVSLVLLTGFRSPQTTLSGSETNTSSAAGWFHVTSTKNMTTLWIYTVTKMICWRKVAAKIIDLRAEYSWVLWTPRNSKTSVLYERPSLAIKCKPIWSHSSLDWEDRSAIFFSNTNILNKLICTEVVFYPWHIKPAGFRPLNTLESAPDPMINANWQLPRFAKWFS